MLSFIVPARNQRDETRECLRSIWDSLLALGLESRAEFILLDDHSDPVHELTALFQNFRNAVSAPVTIARFKKWQHYTGVFAYGLSKARGEHLFFISNDMVMNPSWIRTVLAVSALDPTFGVVRGTAEYVDSHPEHEVWYPFKAVRSRDDWWAFARFVADRVGLLVAHDNLLSGDAVLVSRALVKRIGVLDRRFFGYFGDPDFGLRAQRAGFKLVCAKGAWIKHHGAGHIRGDAAAQQTSIEEQSLKRKELVQAAYKLFRLKWDLSMPEQFTSTDAFDFDRLRSVQKPKGFEFTEPVKDDPDLLELL